MAKPLKLNNLELKNPTLAKEWHTTKNGKLTPRDFVKSSRQKVWWKCSKGHEWQAMIVGRDKGNNCPYCTGTLPSKENNFKKSYPKLSKEWHLKNKLTPSEVTPHSQIKVWWKCDKGHEWESSINTRSRGYGCPYCSGAKPCKDNCLETIAPKLAKEWHPTKNGELTPRDVTKGSMKKVWWKCAEGHEWQTTVNSRYSGTGCRKCRWK
jgi:hypothetical protein